MNTLINKIIIVSVSILALNGLQAQDVENLVEDLSTEALTSIKNELKSELNNIHLVELSVAEKTDAISSDENASQTSTSNSLFLSSTLNTDVSNISETEIRIKKSEQRRLREDLQRVLKQGSRY